MPIKKQIINEICQSETIIIHRHMRPDPDAIGSQGGLRSILKNAFPSKNIYAVGEEVESLHFLTRMDTIEDEVFKDALCIVLDTANTERISDDRFTLAKKVIKIDHHPEREHEAYGDIKWIDPKASSTSEMIATLCYGVFTMTDDAARLLYTGIVGDTGRFQFSNTTALTHKVASTLLKFNFSPNDIFDILYTVKENVARLEGHIKQHFKRTKSGIAYFNVTEDILRNFDVSVSEASNLVNCLSHIVGNHVWVFFIQESNGIRIRVRSRKIIINKLAESWGGGGHPLASGVFVKNWTEANDFLESLDLFVK